MLKSLRKYWNLHRLSILIILASVIFYFVFAYQLERQDFPKLLGLYLALFFFCFKLIQFEKWNFKLLLVAGILFRVVFLWSEPNLSQDFYRFLWDGHLWILGGNPYLNTPDELMAMGGMQIPNASVLHEGMGALSSRNYSNYPPLNQLFFALAALWGGKSIMGTVIASRLILIFADIGIFYFGKKLLLFLNRSPHLIFWYFLNPLCVIELTGNLHYEGLMLFFFIWALYMLAVNRWVPAALLLGASISIKLIPLLFLPLFLKNLGWLKSLAFYSLVFLLAGISLMPFYTAEFFPNYTATLRLWFSNFEFNASLYNLAKTIGYQFDIRSWELIRVYGKITPLITALTVFLLSFLRKRTLGVLLENMLIAISIFYFMSPTVHPWYIIFPLAISLFTNYRFPILWSALVMLSYSAYMHPQVKESMLMLSIEYIIVFGFLCYELFRHKSYKSLFQKN
ncbi:mannosyltransferase [Lentiprolixibacter aurantiacus]|uniref:Mannosyltransferase n=1 Tax=Lentiprolixibacter aurantiacus TaxID=2993939 RepID=A0AAE3MI76_9FLAO|nr:mannosyltransferase [Lentiprolixibacter aurantiacus]MCX2718145.1 mannosyltransferase [Lentiprolixibacter aurantiacus]